MINKEKICSDEELFKRNIGYLSLLELYSIKSDVEQKIREIDSLVPKINCTFLHKLTEKLGFIDNEIKAKEFGERFQKLLFCS